MCLYITLECCQRHNSTSSRNDLLCVEWNVKLYTLSHVTTSARITAGGYPRHCCW